MAGKVVLDLNNPVFFERLADAEPIEVSRVLKALKKAQGMPWDEFVQAKGFHREKVDQVEAPNGGCAYSIRLSQKYRALAYREGDFLRLLSLHLDHDSAYKRR